MLTEDQVKWTYCRLSTEDDEYAALEAAYDSMPPDVRQAITEADITTKVANRHRKIAEEKVTAWTQTVLCREFPDRAETQPWVQKPPRNSGATGSTWTATPRPGQSNVRSRNE